MRSGSPPWLRRPLDTEALSAAGSPCRRKTRGSHPDPAVYKGGGLQEHSSAFPIRRAECVARRQTIPPSETFEELEAGVVHVFQQCGPDRQSEIRFVLVVVGDWPRSPDPHGEVSRPPGSDSCRVQFENSSTSAKRSSLRPARRGAVVELRPSLYSLSLELPCRTWPQAVVPVDADLLIYTQRVPHQACEFGFGKHHGKQLALYHGDKSEPEPSARRHAIG